MKENFNLRINKAIDNGARDKEASEIIREFDDQEHAKQKEIINKIAKLKDQISPLQKKFIDKIKLLEDVINLQIALNSEEKGNVSNEDDRLQIYNKKIGEWDNFTETEEYKEFQSMDDMEQQIKDLEKTLIENTKKLN